MKTEGFTLESLLQSFSEAFSEAEKQIEAAQRSRSLLIESMSVDLDLIRKPNDLFDFAVLDNDNPVSCQFTKLAGQKATLVLKNIEGTKHV